MSKTQDQVLGHGDECDGIEEYDNDLPAWWVGLFILSVVGGIAYGINWHFVSETSQLEQYQEEMALAEAQWPAMDMSEEVVVTDEMIAEGKELYMSNCIGCHGPEMKGGIGPDLTDAEWIHGGTFNEIQETVSKGVPEKGMLSWEPILGPQKVQKVTAYVHAAGGGQ